MNEKKLQEIIGWSPYKPKRHNGQIEILNSKSEKVVVFAGKGFGKSMVTAYIVLKTFLSLIGEIQAGKRRSLKIWIVAPTYDLSRKVFNYFISWLMRIDKEFGQYYSDRAGPKLEIAPEVWVQGKSADEPQSLMGERLDLLVIDEAPYVRKKVWEHELSPTMALSENSRVFFIGTPRGKNWVYQEWLKAKEFGGAFRFPSSANPYLSKKRLEDIKANISKGAWEQEYLAIPQEQASSVFRNIHSVVGDCVGDPEPGHRYVMGVDLAQVRDYSVLIVMDEDTHRVRAYDRFKKIDYPLQIDRIEAMAVKYNNAKIIVEENNIGFAVIDELRARGLRVKGFKTQGTVTDKVQGSKEQLIKKLALDIENQNIMIPNWTPLIDELDIYGQELTPAGHIKYGAPEGFHDDCVMALALANWGIMGKSRQRRIIQRRSIIIPRKKRFQYN